MAGSVDGTLSVKAEVKPFGQPVVTVGPVDFSLTNLTVDEIRCESGQGGGEVVEAGELFMAVTSPTTVEYEVDLLDGYECPTEASANLTLRLLTLGVGQTRQATTTGTAPGTMTGVFGTSLPIGFYYKEGTASEPVTYDTASNLSSFWYLTNVALTGYEYMGGRKARITVEAEPNTAALPSAASFAWCKPLPAALGRPVPPDVLTVPAATYAADLGDVEVTFGGSTGLDLSVAGVHRLAMAFRDTGQYHAPGVGRWTPPQAVTLEIPGPHATRATTAMTSRPAHRVTTSTSDSGCTGPWVPPSPRGSQMPRTISSMRTGTWGMQPTSTHLARPAPPSRRLSPTASEPPNG